MITKTITISGKVQGVFFRVSAQKMARRMGLTGKVSNLTSGEVEVMVSGEEAVVQEFIEWCRKGPSNAKVESVEIADNPFTPFSGFEIVH